MTKTEDLKPCTVDGCKKRPKSGDSYCSMHRARLSRTGRLDLKSTKERLMEKVTKTEAGCWEWSGYRNKLGYGRLRVNGSKMLAHRASYQEFVGEITGSLLVCHKCDNPPCINPEHLFLGTDQDNVQDCISKGRFNGWGNSPWIK